MKDDNSSVKSDESDENLLFLIMPKSDHMTAQLQKKKEDSDNKLKSLKAFPIVKGLLSSTTPHCLLVFLFNVFLVMEAIC